jgi:pectate lyase
MAGLIIRSRPLLLVLFSYVLATVVVAAVSSNVTSDEEYWARRAKEARANNRAAYVSDPVTAMNRFNTEMLRATTRRSLRGYRGSCAATNRPGNLGGVEICEAWWRGL